MIIENVMDEIGAALDTVNGLRVHSYDEDKVVPPAALISLPTGINFLAAYGRGMDEMTLVVTLLVSRTGGGRTRRAAIAPYADGVGPKSVKKALERHQYRSCDVVAVASAEFANIKMNEATYLGVIFTVNIAGQGG